MLAPHRIVAAERRLVIVPPLVRDHRCVELVGVDVLLAQHIDLPTAASVVEEEGRADLPRREVDRRGRRVVGTPENLQHRKRRSRRHRQHLLHGGVDRVEHGERRCDARPAVARTSPAAVRTQVARQCHASRRKARRLHRVQRVAAGVVAHRDIPGRARTGPGQLGPDAHGDVRVRRHRDRVIATVIRGGQRELRRCGGIEHLYRGAAHGLGCGVRVQEGPAVVRHRVVSGFPAQGDRVQHDRQADGKPTAASATTTSPTATCQQCRRDARRTECKRELLAHHVCCPRFSPGALRPAGRCARMPHLRNKREAQKSPPAFLQAGCARNATRGRITAA
ncbi:hypothetical protein D3C71_1152850 [compost metagenome]